MVETDPVEDKALLYLLGELPEKDAREFERRMESSPELVERVRELEEGAIALALACPPKKLPKQVWSNIERAVESKRRIIVPWEWFRGKGWAAAAACLVGWFLYAVFTPRPRPTEQSLNPTQTTEGRDV